MPTISVNTMAFAVSEMFRLNPAWQSLAVVKDDHAVGLICRAELQALFSQPFGRALNEKKTVAQIMNTKVVIVEADKTLDEVSQIVAEDEYNAVSWYFIISRQGRYLGIGSVRQLLKRVSEHKLQHARYANPLTFLPGNVPIYREIDNLLTKSVAFAVAYLDLNHFKPFNDIYGYSKGDAVLQLLAEIIQQQAAGKDHFVGHIGGDDFVLITAAKTIEPIFGQILLEVAARVPAFYAYTDAQNGEITAQSRSGESCFYPILSLAIGVALPDPLQCQNHHDVAALSTAAKCEAKKIGG